MAPVASNRHAFKGIAIALFHLILTYHLKAQTAVHSFSPSSGPAGTVVTISGANFSPVAGDNTVYFGATKANVTAATTNTLTVIAPVGATYEPITVTTNGSTAYASLPFVVTFPGGAAITPWSFESYNIAAGVTPGAVVSSDVDGDGKADMVVLNTGYPYSISVFRNTSNSSSITFASSVSFNTGIGPSGIATGDLDGDGKTDIAVSNYFSFTISVFRNTSTPGNISFVRTDLPAHLPGDIAIGDLNNDGKPDIAVTNLQSSTLSLFKNTGSPGVLSFAPKVDHPTAQLPTDLCIGDLDGDHWHDIIISGIGITIFKNNRNAGSPSFTITGGINTSTNQGEIALADIDGDAKPDVNITDGQAIAVFRNTGSSGTVSFAPGISFQATTYADGLHISDIDGDGKVDLVTGDGANSIGILRNASTMGAVTFNAIVNITTETPAWKLGIADYNGDQKPDIATANGNENSVTIFRNRIDEPTILSFTPTQSAEGGNITITGLNLQGATAVTFGDVDAQSFTITSATTIHAVVGAGASGDVRVTAPTGTGIASGFIFFPMPQISSFTPESAYAGEEITIKGKYFTGATAVMFGGNQALSFNVLSDTTITATVNTGTTGAIRITTPGGTVNQTGFTYLVSGIAPVITSFTPATGPVGTTVTIAGNYFSSAPAGNIVYFGATRATVLTAAANSLTVQVPYGASYQPITVTTDRLTAQTQVPFIVTYPATGPSFTAGSFSHPEVVDRNGISSNICSPDINGDGKPDLIHSYPHPNKIRILKNTSTGNAVAFSEVTELPGLTGTCTLATADMDGDGKIDIIAAHQNYLADPPAISIKKNISTVNTVAFAPEVNIPVAASGALVVSDLDLDGRPDVVVTSIADNTMSVYRNTSNGNFISLSGKTDYATGDAPMHVSAADIDGDGLPEIITTNWHANTISIYRNTSTPGAIHLASPIVMAVDDNPFGTSIADYDGDGKPDIAVIHQTLHAAVFVYRNTSTAGAIVVAPKVRIDLPSTPIKLKSGDLDGDGKPDIVVHTNSILVYVKNNSSPGNLAFTAGVNYQHNDFPIDITIADFDGDSKSDIATSMSGITILRNQIGAARLERSGFDPLPAITINRSVVDANTQTYNGKPYVQRHYDVVPATNAATTNAIVTLYFTQSEFDNYNAFSGHGPDLPKDPADAANKANLRIYQFHGESVTATPGSYSGLGVEIDPDDANIVWNTSAACWEVTFTVNGFSGFFAASIGFIPPATPPAITANGNIIICQGESVFLTSSATNNQWYKDGVAINGATAVTYQVTTAGVYTATTVSNSFLSGPSNSIYVEVNAIPAKPFIQLNGNTLYSNPTADAHQWYLDGKPIEGATNSSYTPERSGYYSVVDIRKGCSSPESDKLFRPGPVTGVVNIDNEQFISLSPNPVTDQVQLSFKLSTTFTLNIQLVDMRGQIIGSFNRLSNGSPINLGNISTGIYIARIFNPKNKKYYFIKVLKL